MTECRLQILQLVRRDSPGVYEWHQQPMIRGKVEVMNDARQALSRLDVKAVMITKAESAWRKRDYR